MSAAAPASEIILVVDDDGDSLERLRHVLTDAGWKVETALSGSEALAKARRLNPDAIVLDLLMPGMTGADVLHRLRADERTKRIPVIAVTGVPEWLRQHGGLAAEFDDVLLKPVPDQRLIEAIRASITGSNRKQ